MDGPGKDFVRLYEAAHAFLASRPEGDTDDALLARHAELRDLLEPMLAPVTADDTGEEGSRVLGDYRILRELGRGGMGVVYEAHQESLNRRVALKVLPAHLTLRRESVVRFHREAKTAARLDHPGIVDIHAVGSEGETHYFAMELVEGAPLDRVLDRVRELRRGHGTLDGEVFARALGASVVHRSPDGAHELSPAAVVSFAWPARWVECVVRLLLQVADALEHAHMAGIVHRDVKPSNILVRQDGTAALTDFGLAREVGLPSLTMTGDFAGTPHYVSPEQAEGSGREIDRRSDVFALGATLYELLTLERPFGGETAREVLDAIRTEDPVEPQRHDHALAADLGAIVMKALEKDRGRRYQTARDFADDLRAFLDYRPVKAQRTNLTARMRRYGRRVARRHPALIAGTGVGVAAVLIGSLLVIHGRGRDAQLEYDRLCALAEGAMSGYLARVTWLMSEGSVGRAVFQREVHSPEPVGAPPRATYDRAIELAPHRPEAWFGRALTPGRQLDARLADLDAARARGLSARTFHLARAYLLRAGGRLDDSEREQAAAGESATGSPADAYFEGIFQVAAGSWPAAHELLTRAIDGLPRHDSLRHRALRSRATIRDQSGDHAGALADLYVVLDQGDGAAVTCARIARAWRRLDQRAEAERWVGEALRRARGRGTVSAWTGVCAALQDTRWFEPATAQAIAAHPDAADLLELRATALQDTGRAADALELGRRALEIHPNHSALHHSLAITFVRLQRYDDALAAIDRAIALDANHVGARRNRGNVLGFLNRLDEALSAFDAAQELDPTNPNVYISRGALLANECGRFEDALAQFDRACELGARGFSVHVNRAIVLDHLDRHQEALEAVDRALAAAATERRRASGLRVRGDVLADEERFEEALAAYQEARRLDPTEPEHHSKAGAILQERLGRSEEALAAIEQALALDPRRAGDWQNKAIALASMRRFEAALDAIETALRLDARGAMRHRVHGIVLRVLGKFDEAAAALSEAHRCDPTDVITLTELGVILHNRLGRSDEALEMFEAAIRIDPGRNWQNKAIVLESLGRFEEALAAIGEAIRRAPEDPGLVSWRGCLLNDSLFRREQALADFERALELDPERDADWHYRGVVLQALGRSGEALDAYDEAIRIAPEVAQHHARRGVVLNDDFERHEDALAAFDRALELQPDLLVAQRNRGIALKALGRYEEAVVAFDRALAVDEHDAYARFMRGSALYLSGDLDAAESSLVRAAELDPSWPQPLLLRGHVLLVLGRLEESLACCEAVLRLTPDDAGAQNARAFLLASLGRFDEVRAPDGEILADWVWALVIMGRFGEALVHALELDDPYAKVYCLRANGRAEAARSEARDAASGPIPTTEQVRFAYLCAAAGDGQKARASLDAHEGPWRPIDMQLRARVHCVLGEKELAIEWLGRAADAGLRWPATMAPDPDLDALSGDPRYRSVVTELHRPR